MKGIYVTDTKGINGNGVDVFICSDPKQTDHRFMIFPVLAPMPFHSSSRYVRLSVCVCLGVDIEIGLYPVRLTKNY